MTHDGGDGAGATARRLRRVSGVLVQEVDGQLLLLREGSSDVLHLDEVAATVWHLLEDAPTRAGLAEAVAQAYGVGPQRVLADLEPVLFLLLQHGVVSELP